MAAFHGKQGKATFAAATIINIISWSIDATADVTEATVMNNTAVTSTAFWKEYIASFKDWTATIEVLADTAALNPDLGSDFALDEDGLALVLFTGTNPMGARKYTGNAIITNISVSTPKDDVSKVTYSLQGSGTLTEAAVPV